MKEYLKNILPSITKYSKALDKKSLFAGQSWVLIDEQLNKHQYIFKKDGQLLLSVNGKGKVGTWELIPSSNSLWIDNGEEKLLLNQAFIDDGIMILKMDSFTETLFVLMNPNVVKDLDAPAYLASKLKTITDKEGQIKDRDLAIKNKKLIKAAKFKIDLKDGNQLTISRPFNIKYPHNLIGRKMLNSTNTLVDGNHEVIVNRGFQFFLIIKGGKITDYFCQMTYQTASGDDICIIQKTKTPSFGDKYVNSNLGFKGWVMINPIDGIGGTYLYLKNGRILFTLPAPFRIEFFALIFVTILIFGLIFFLMRAFS